LISTECALEPEVDLSELRMEINEILIDYVMVLNNGQECYTSVVLLLDSYRAVHFYGTFLLRTHFKNGQ
jgi:hypothetical protein